MCDTTRIWNGGVTPHLDLAQHGNASQSSREKQTWRLWTQFTERYGAGSARIAPSGSENYTNGLAIPMLTPTHKISRLRAVPGRLELTNPTLYGRVNESLPQHPFSTQWNATSSSKSTTRATFADGRPCGADSSPIFGQLKRRVDRAARSPYHGQHRLGRPQLHLDTSCNNNAELCIEGDGSAAVACSHYFEREVV